MRMSGGGSDVNVNVIVMGNKQMTSSSCSSDAFQFQALLSSPVLNGSRPMGNLEEVISNGNVSKRPFYTSLEQEETGDEDMEDYLHPPEKKRRLTTEQVQFLERSFEVENKLEPERKIQLARDLGLQPRQVAVWFQNRRARWKTKQLERDYDLLKSRYDNLRADYDNLLKEKDKLKAEVNFLEDKIHSKDQDLKIKTKDLETVDKKASRQSLFYSECLEKPEMETSIKNPPAICKHEDLLSSGTDSSGVLDEDSPRHINCGHSSLADQVNSSHAFEAYQSDISLADEEEEEEDGMSEILLPQTFHLLKVGGLYPEASEVSCNDIFPIDDQGNLPWWEWP